MSALPTWTVEWRRESGTILMRNGNPCGGVNASTKERGDLIAQANLAAEFQEAVETWEERLKWLRETFDDAYGARNVGYSEGKIAELEKCIALSRALLAKAEKLSAR